MHRRHLATSTARARVLAAAPDTEPLVRVRVQTPSALPASTGAAILRDLHRHCKQRPKKDLVMPLNYEDALKQEMLAMAQRGRCDRV